VLSVGVKTEGSLILEGKKKVLRTHSRSRSPRRSSTAEFWPVAKWASAYLEALQLPADCLQCQLDQKLVPSRDGFGRLISMQQLNSDSDSHSDALL